MRNSLISICSTVITILYKLYCTISLLYINHTVKLSMDETVKCLFRNKLSLNVTLKNYGLYFV